MNSSETAPPRNVVVITLEGVPVSLVGTYGSNVGRTPFMNWCAARGVVWDQCFLDSLDLQGMLTSLWTGQHALCPPRADQATVWQLHQQAGGRGVMITDCPRAADAAEQAGCPQVRLIHPPETTRPAEEPDQCGLMAVFAEAAEAVAELVAQAPDADKLVWVHSRCLRLPWDAPEALRLQLADADDPPPPGEVGPPCFPVLPETDPDEVVGWTQVAAAQVAVVDEAMAGLAGCLQELQPDWSYCLVGLGGVPLGENQQMGWLSHQLCGAQLQAVAIVVPTPPLDIGLRRAELCQLPDLGSAILALCGLAWPQPVWGEVLPSSTCDGPPASWPPAQQLAVVVEGSQIWVRAPAWSLVCQAAGDHRLYVKPDDRWEVSEISARCPEQVAALYNLGEQFIAAARAANRRQLPPLDEPLCNLMR